MKENRYFQMVYLLLARGSMTAPALAAHFEVSVRTIYRDIDMLSAVGIPVFATQGKGGGIAIEKNYVLNKALLSQVEQNHILMALQGMKLVGGEDTDALLTKLGSLFAHQRMDWLEIDFTGWRGNQAVKEAFDLARAAICQGKRVSFHYASSKGENIERLVEPHKLVCKGADWFMQGFCCTRGDFRLFKLSRIKGLTVTQDGFIRRSPPDCGVGQGPMVQDTVAVTLLFHPSLSFRVYDEFDEGITPQEDGALLVTAQLPQHERLYSYLFSFGDKVEVLAPEALRAEMGARAKKIGDYYIT